MNKLKLICGGLFLALSLSLFTGCGSIKKEKVVDAVVTGKEFKEGYTWFSVLSTGKTTIPIPHTEPDQHLTIVKYEGMELSIDDTEKYEHLKIGESIKVLLVQKYDKKTGEYLSSYLEKAD